MKDNFDTALGHALSLTLSDWDDKLTNQQLWEAVHSEDFDKVTFWEMFEDWNGNDLANYIENIAHSILTFHNIQTEQIKHSLMDAFLGKDYK